VNPLDHAILCGSHRFEEFRGGIPRVSGVRRVAFETDRAPASKVTKQRRA